MSRIYRFLTVVLIFSAGCTSVFSLENKAKADLGTDFMQMPVTESRQIQAAHGVIAMRIIDLYQI